MVVKTDLNSIAIVVITIIILITIMAMATEVIIMGTQTRSSLEL